MKVRATLWKPPTPKRSIWVDLDEMFWVCAVTAEDARAHLIESLGFSDEEAPAEWERIGGSTVIKIKLVDLPRSLWADEGLPRGACIYAAATADEWAAGRDVGVIGSTEY